MHTHIYATSNSRILAVDDTDEARDLVPHCRMPRAMFGGRAVPQPVARAYVEQYGGIWFHPTGLERFKTPARTGSLEVHDGDTVIVSGHDGEGKTP